MNSVLLINVKYALFGRVAKVPHLDVAEDVQRLKSCEKEIEVVKKYEEN